MGDIDFDELDKAVNSLMNSSDAPKGQKNNSAKHASKAAPAHRRHTSAVRRVAPAKPAVKTMDMKSAPVSSGVPRPTPIKRSGRFMDVVDSSAELNPIRKPMTMPAREVARPTLEPAVPKPLVTDDAPVKQPHDFSFSPTSSHISQLSNDKDTAVSTASTISSSEPVQVRLVPKSVPGPAPLELKSDSPATKADIPEHSADDSVRPAAVFGPLVVPPRESVASKESIELENQAGSDPLAMPLVSSKAAEVPMQPLPSPTSPANDVSTHELANETPAERDESELPNLEAVASELSAQLSEITPPETESPFLVNTKVEKRPLSANLAELNDKVANIGIEQPTDDATSSTSANDELADMHVPAMAHEQQVSEVPELSTELVAIEATGRGEYELDEPPVPIKSSTDGSQKKIKNSPAVVGATSIVQQYESKESSGDSSHAPIYDASEYTEPVAHPAKKKSGWLWVLVIFIILALASGGAVALYVAGIIP